MRPLLLVILMTVGSASVKAGVLNLRGIDIGDSCDLVAFTEVARGGNAAPTNQTAAYGSLLYTDSSVAGQVTQVLYGCFGDYGLAKVERYSITVSTTDADGARKAYVTAKAAVVARLGAPALDSDQLNPADKKAFDAVPGGPRALSSWNGPNAYIIHVSLQQSANSSAWTVVTAVAPPSAIATPKQG
jgi:hypothetical protein